MYLCKTQAATHSMADIPKAFLRGKFAAISSLISIVVWSVSTTGSKEYIERQQSILNGTKSLIQSQKLLEENIFVMGLGKTF